MLLNVFYCGNCIFSVIFCLKCLEYDIVIIGDGLNLIFLCICIEICEYVMSMIVVIIYIKVVIVCIMLLNKVKFYKLMFLF